MCLTIKTNTVLIDEAIKKHKKIAKKDRVVYKRLYKGVRPPWKNQFGSGDEKITYKSPFQWYKYEMGCHYYQEGGNKFTFSHSINYLSDAYLYKYKLEVYQGLHAYTHKKVAIYNSDPFEVVVECIIPKGSEYFVDRKLREIVSDNLILIRELCA